MFIRDLIEFSDALGYKKVGSLRNLFSHIKADPEQREILEDKAISIIQHSVRNELSIFSFPGKFYEVSPFGYSSRHFKYSEHFSQNYILFDHDLNEKFLRKIFTGIELLLFKSIHIILHEQSADYTFEREKTYARLNALRDKLQIDDFCKYKSVFDDVFFVRDAFAHSFIKICDIKYNGVPLDECFGGSHLGKTLWRAIDDDGARCFIDDVKYIFAPLHSLFASVQLQQFDANKLFILCDALTRKRSLFGR